MKKVIKKVDFQYLEKLYELHNDLPYLPERMKYEKVGKFMANLHNKTEYPIQKFQNKH